MKPKDEESVATVTRRVPPVCQAGRSIGAACVSGCLRDRWRFFDADLLSSSTLTRRSSAPVRTSGHHDQQLTRIVVVDQGVKGLKIATQIRPDDREGATTEVIGNGYLPHSREVLSTRRRGRGLPRRGSPGRNVREVSTGLHPPAA